MLFTVVEIKSKNISLETFFLTRLFFFAIRMIKKFNEGTQIKISLPGKRHDCYFQLRYQKTEVIEHYMKSLCDRCFDCFRGSSEFQTTERFGM